ncbi:MAG: oligosaccharide flippase family protein [Bacteroidota bacterium]
MHKDIQVFFTHFLQLALLRGISRILPLITVPFLLRTIGIEKYGTILFVQALSFYFNVFINYGFNYSATKQIVLHKQDKAIIGQLLGAVYTLKLAAIGISLAIIGLLIFFVPSIQQTKYTLLCFVPVIIASTLFPGFVFQGLEKMWWMTLLNLLSKLLFLTGVFTLIRSPADDLLYPTLLSIADTLRLAAACYLIYYRLGVGICLPTQSMIYSQLREGVHIFLSNFTINFYTRLPVIFLNFFASPSSAAIYSLGDKVARTTVGMIEPFTQALFPIASRKMTKSFQAGFRFIGSVIIANLVILLIIGTCYCLFATSIIQLLAGELIQEAVWILKLHAFLPCIVILSNTLGINALVPAGAGGKYIMTMLMTGLICAGLHFVLVPQLQARGAAWAILLCEAFATVMMLFWTSRIHSMTARVVPSSHTDVF